MTRAAMALRAGVLALLATPALGAQPLVDAELGVELTSRSLRYNDDLFHRLNGYSLAAAPGLYARVVFSPGVLTQRRVASAFALTAGADYVAAPDSLDARGTAYEVRAWGYTVGLRARLPAPLPDVGLELAYVAQRFTLGRSTPGLDGGVPNLAAQSVRIGVAARVPVRGPLAVFGHLAYLAPISNGTAQGLYFPRMTWAAVEAGAGVEVSVGARLSVRLGAELRRYFSAMGSEPGDVWVVGGAVDQFVTGTLGIAWRR